MQAAAAAGIPHVAAAEGAGAAFPHLSHTAAGVIPHQHSFVLTPGSAALPTELSLNPQLSLSPECSSQALSSQHSGSMPAPGYSQHSPRLSHGLCLGPLHPAGLEGAAPGRAASDGTASTHGAPGRPRMDGPAGHHSLVSICSNPHAVQQGRVGLTPSPASFEFAPLQLKAQHEATAKLTQHHARQHYASRIDVQRQSAPAVASQAELALPIKSSQVSVTTPLQVSEVMFSLTQAGR